MAPSDELYLELLHGLLLPQFVANDPSLCTSAELDFEYCSKRYRTEGVRFLTVQLPALRKAVDLSFKTGHIEVPKTFSLKAKTGLPRFLFSHFEKIYNPDGSLLARPYVNRITHVRQVLEAFYKLELPYSPATEAATLENFVLNEARVRTFLNDEERWASPSDLRVLSGASMLCRYVFDNFDPAEIAPRHGPGALATGEVGEEKWVFHRKYSALHQEFPTYTYMYGNRDMLMDLLDHYRGLDAREHGVSKITLVPKDSRGPRIITMEPLEYMFLQQGLGRKMMSWLEASEFTMGHINFTDQTVNQDLARISSLSGEWATLDLKDASDLLSDDLVKLVFRLKPRLLRKLLALRTPETEFPNGEGMRLKKFAGMGSALCFPVESFVFWAICVSAIAIELGISLRDATEFVYVFGDDIIVPTELAQTVIVGLEGNGLRVNTDKSYDRGPFRESCGFDAFLSVNVTPTRFKKQFPAAANVGTALEAWAAYANAFMAKRYTRVSNLIWDELVKVFGPIPHGVSTSAFPSRIEDDPSVAEELNVLAGFRKRVSKDYQRLEFRVRTVVPVTSPSELDDWARLSRNLVSGTGDEPSIFVQPRMTKVVWAWMPV